MRVAFSGLGQMGKHMAANLATKSGAELLVHDLRPDSFAELQAKGAEVTTDLAAVADADVVILCLPSSRVVQSVILAPDGLAARLTPGKTIVDTSTITYTATAEIAQQLNAKGIKFIDAPISGMEARAKDGTLTVMCGGERETFENIEPLLHCFGNKILYMGAAGSGQLTKLINQLLYDISVAALAEVLPMAVKMGLDPTLVGQVVNSGTGRSYASEFFIPRILEGSFSEAYPLEAAYKDLISAAELGANRCIPMPVLAAATATYQLALLRGHGKQDKGAMIQVYEELLGVKFRNSSSVSGGAS